MSNFDTLLVVLSNLKNYPVLISISPILFSAMIYLLGKIRVSNSWQYHLENKYISLLHGIVVLNKFAFIPILITIFSFNWKVILTTRGGLLALSLFIFYGLIGYFANKLIKAESIINPEKKINKDKKRGFKNFIYLNGYVFLISVAPLILYLLSYFVLLNTINNWVLIYVVIIDFLALVFFAMLDTILEARRRVSILIDKGKSKMRIYNVRIIEFINDGQFMKFEHNKNVMLIPTSKILGIYLN